MRNECRGECGVDANGFSHRVRTICVEERPWKRRIVSGVGRNESQTCFRHPVTLGCKRTAHAVRVR